MSLSPTDRRRQYEAKVRDRASAADVLRAEGEGEEAIARLLVDRRNALKVEARSDDHPDVVTLLESRNLRKYGNRIGPDADALFAKYGSWTEVIAAACRPATLS